MSTYGAGMAHQTLDIARSMPRGQAGATIGLSIPLIDSRFFVDLQPAEQARDDCTGAETAAPISGLDLDCGSRRGADQASRRPKPQGRAWCRNRRQERRPPCLLAHDPQPATSVGIARPNGRAVQGACQRAPGRTSPSWGGPVSDDHRRHYHDPLAEQNFLYPV